MHCLPGRPNTSHVRPGNTGSSSPSYSSFLSRDSDPAEFGISPVEAFTISFNHPGLTTRVPAFAREHQLCLAGWKWRSKDAQCSTFPE